MNDANRSAAACRNPMTRSCACSGAEINCARSLDRRGDRPGPSEVEGRSPAQPVNGFAMQSVSAETGDGPSPLRVMLLRTTYGDPRGKQPGMGLALDTALGHNPPARRFLRVEGMENGTP
jgi:hypothetical protein